MGERAAVLADVLGSRACWTAAGPAKRAGRRPGRGLARGGHRRRSRPGSGPGGSLTSLTPSADAASEYGLDPAVGGSAAAGVLELACRRTRTRSGRRLRRGFARGDRRADGDMPTRVGRGGRCAGRGAGGGRYVGAGAVAGSHAGGQEPVRSRPPDGAGPARGRDLMGTPPDPTGELRDLASDCVHCGFCLPACPTYQLWGEEMDSPRGRIHLITQILDSGEGSAAAAEHFDRCLGCMACVPACPSGVRYDRLIEGARTWAEGEPGAARVLPARSRRDRAVRAAIFATLPVPAAAAGAARSAPGGAADEAGPGGAAQLGARPARARGGRGARGRAGRLAVPAPAGCRSWWRPAASGARSSACSPAACSRCSSRGSTRRPPRVLASEGCDVVIPRGQGCCGALSLHSGRHEEAMAFARAAIETFERAGVDAIVVNAAGCGSAMKEYAGCWRRPGLGRPGGRAQREGAGLQRVPGRAGAGRAALRAGADGRLSRRLPPRARAADHARSRAACSRGIPGLTLAELGDGGHLLRLGRHLQPGPAGRRGRAGPAQGARGARGVGGPAGVGQPRLRAADQQGAHGRRRAAAADGARRRGPRRLDPGRFRQFPAPLERHCVGLAVAGAAR